MPQKKKKPQKKKNQHQLRLYALVVAAALSLAVIVVAGWLVYDSRKTAEEPVSTVCTVDDEKLCNFFTVNGARSSLRATVTTTSPKGTTTTVKYEEQGNGRLRYQVKEGKTTLEYIIIDKIIYMKGADGTWWKQVLSPAKLEQYSRGYDFKFKTPDMSAEDGEQITYSMYSTEWYTYPYQLKYQVNDAGSPNDTSFIWFDMDEYLLRRYTKQSSEGTMDVSFSYEDVLITEPSDVKVLGPNEFILPGKSKPEVVTTKP